MMSTGKLISKKPLISKEAWPALGIERYRSVDDGPWGYLLVFADGRFEFDPNEQPSREEILARWSAYLSDSQ